MAERQALRDAILIGRVHHAHAAQIAAALRALGLAQVPSTGARAQHFAASRNLEPLGRGLLRLNAFWTSHKSIHFLSEKSAQYRGASLPNQAVFWDFWHRRHRQKAEVRS
jgi:hypothetical protein